MATSRSRIGVGPEAIAPLGTVYPVGAVAFMFFRTLIITVKTIGKTKARTTVEMGAL
jgi:hypothetical protein